MTLDLHVHTSETSGCGKVPAAEMARLYKEAGYDGITITDHLIARKNIEMPTEDRVNWYLGGYRAAKAEGERLGLVVLLGAELRFVQGNEDFLLFGLEDSDIPYLMGLLDSGMSEEDFYPLIHSLDRFVMIQAHPFREGLRQMPLDCLDGIEVYNGHPGHDSHNDLALQRAHLGGADFIFTSGSDAHQVPHVGRGGMLTDVWIDNTRAQAAWLRAHPRGQRIET